LHGRYGNVGKGARALTLRSYAVWGVALAAISERAMEMEKKREGQASTGEGKHDKRGARELQRDLPEVVLKFPE